MIPTTDRMPLPPFPNGWFQVGGSEELEPGQVMPLSYFGTELVMFRTEDGELSVLDAYCPHLGAHLGHGGKVKGGCIECPFHAWQFDVDGNCTEVPYANKIPPKAKMHRWPAREVNGNLYVWHHSLGEPPSWEIPVLEEIGHEDWTSYVRKDWIVRSRNQEMAENGVDSAHFRYLHGTTNQPEARAEIDGHILKLWTTTGMSTPRGGINGEIHVQEHGFGFTTTRFAGIVDTLLLASVTPIDDEQVHLRFAFTVKKLAHGKVTDNVARAFIGEISRQVTQDIPIWENKRYLPRPVLCDGDGPIGVFRRWARQFYTVPPNTIQPSVRELDSAANG